MLLREALVLVDDLVARGFDREKVLDLVESHETPAAKPVRKAMKPRYGYREKIKAALAKGKPRTQEELYAEVGGSREACRTTIARMVKSREVAESADGKFCIAS